MSNTSTTFIPNKGDKAPDFELPDINMKMYKLTDFLKKKVVLVFFPAAESPVCTVEMCTFRDSLGELKGLFLDPHEYIMPLFLLDH